MQHIGVSFHGEIERVSQTRGGHHIVGIQKKQVVGGCGVDPAIAAGSGPNILAVVQDSNLCDTGKGVQQLNVNGIQRVVHDDDFGDGVTRRQYGSKALF